MAHEFLAMQQQITQLSASMDSRLQEISMRQPHGPDLGVDPLGNCDLAPSPGQPTDLRLSSAQALLAPQALPSLEDISLVPPLQANVSLGLSG